MAKVIYFCVKGDEVDVDGRRSDAMVKHPSCLPPDLIVWKSATPAANEACSQFVKDHCHQVSKVDTIRSLYRERESLTKFNLRVMNLYHSIKSRLQTLYPHQGLVVFSHPREISLLVSFEISPKNAFRPSIYVPPYSCCQFMGPESSPAVAVSNFKSEAIPEDSFKLFLKKQGDRKWVDYNPDSFKLFLKDSGDRKWRDYIPASYNPYIPHMYK